MLHHVLLRSKHLEGRNAGRRILSATSHPSLESSCTQPKDGKRGGKATLASKAHLAITPAPSDHGSPASINEGAFPGRKRGFAEAMGPDEDSQPRLPAFILQAFPPGPRGKYYQHGSCPPHLSPKHMPPLAQPFELRNLLLTTAQRPGPPQVQIC